MRVKAAVLVMVAFAVACSASDDVHAPTISSITPDHATPGASVSIQGDYFCGQPETNGEEDPLACANTGSVSFGQTPGTVGMWTEQLITAEVPGLEAASYPVSVFVAGRSSNGVGFTIDPL